MYPPPPQLRQYISTTIFHSLVVNYEIDSLGVACKKEKCKKYVHKQMYDYVLLRLQVCLSIYKYNVPLFYKYEMGSMVTDYLPHPIII